MTTAERFAAAAASFVGTPFSLNGRRPGEALDCAGVVACALDEVGISHADMQYAIVRGGDMFPQMLELLAGPFDAVDGEWRIGDVLAIRYPPMYNHLGVLVAPDLMVHAYDHRARHEVILMSIDPALKRRVHSAWRLRG
jgi:cell wall-associated NlpC family hydrolase